MNRFEKSLERIEKRVEIQNNWNEDDLEHYKTIIEALEIASKFVDNTNCRNNTICLLNKNNSASDKQNKLKGYKNNEI